MTWLGTRAVSNLNQFMEMMWANGAFNDVGECYLVTTHYFQIGENT